MSGQGNESYWYNLKTGEVEFGFESPSVDRVGMIDQHDAAQLLIIVLAHQDHVGSRVRQARAGDA